MNVFELTRRLVDIESISNNELQVANFLHGHLAKLADRSNGHVELAEVERDRLNVFACWGTPVVTLSTHMDTVPPFIPAREDADCIWGRGSCDAKGIIASMIVAAERLLGEGVRNLGLLFVVGEERDSAGANAAALTQRGSRYLVGGEPTGNKLALAAKGALRFEIVARGKTAHSAYPELGDSAIDALLDALEAVRKLSLPEDPLLGHTTTNIGTIAGGHAPNVIADSAKAEILVRLVGDPDPIREAFAAAVGTRAELKEVLFTPVMRLESIDGFPSTIVSYTTDLPVLSQTWGKPLLIGPGSIHVAHTAEERVSKKELSDAVGIYADIVRRLLAKA
jgi:acetylornithine deacetylase